MTKLVTSSLTNLSSCSHVTKFRSSRSRQIDFSEKVRIHSLVDANVLIGGTKISGSCTQYYAAIGPLYFLDSCSARVFQWMVVVMWIPFLLYIPLSNLYFKVS